MEPDMLPSYLTALYHERKKKCIDNLETPEKYG